MCDSEYFLSSPAPYDYENIDSHFSWAKSFRAGCICIYDGRILAIKERGSGLWGLPKGERNSTDKNIFQTALRETHEEVGYQPNKNEVTMKVFYYKRTTVHSCVQFYIVVVPKAKPEICVDKREISAYKWLTVSQFLSYRISPATRYVIDALRCTRLIGPGGCDLLSS